MTPAGRNAKESEGFELEFRARFGAGTLDWAKVGAYLNAVTINYMSFHLLLMAYMAALAVGALLLFRNNTLLFYASLALEGFVWALAVYLLLSALWRYPFFLRASLLAAEAAR